MSPQSSLGYVGLILSVIIIVAERNTLHRPQSWNFYCGYWLFLASATGQY